MRKAYSVSMPMRKSAEGSIIAGLVNTRPSISRPDSGAVMLKRF